ncbi:MAG TPA: fused MFS/spermidine synthase [Pyrinomonadaceae bacterium]|nr:fused MFS/spermidine synthase [Pyrinomonadaceae bacterium]
MQRHSSQTLLFGLTIFVSAVLLFSVQPLVAKMLLPLLGGTPAVWNTCMVFFQAVLLAGYAYALLASRWPLQRQLMAQIVLLVLAFISLPIGLSSFWVNSVPSTDNPSLWLLACLASAVGLPFFIISSNSPLLQKWFSRTSTASAQDPYFLYSASNAGSLLALLAYPLVLEPYFSLQLQSRLWTGLYGLLVLLIAVCAALLWRSFAGNTAAEAVLPGIHADQQGSSVKKECDKLLLTRRLRWLLLAFAPSSLMLGVTNYITTDIASVPLLWIIPLAIYLLTMVIAFARRQLFSSRLPALVVPGATVVLLMLYLADTSGSGARTLILLHLVYFFFAALMCHSQLAADRPSAEHLAEFYVWLSLGGVLGGVFNALIAPLIFRSVVEYPLVILLACLLLPAREEITAKVRQKRLDFAMPVFIFLLTFGLGWLADKVAPGKVIGLLFVLAVPMFLSYPLRKRPLRFALSLGAVIVGAGFVSGAGGTRILHTERNFFGVVRVTRDEGSGIHWFSHGSTIHGRQSTSPDSRCEPLSYYHREGPLGRIFTQFETRTDPARVAIVGLGAGATAAYTRANESWTFYEINPAVVSIARSREYFTYLGACAQAPLEVVLGDARLKLRAAPDASYNLVVLDAFSSDAIPIHLMTQQALDLYLSKLAPGGLLVFHISNRNLDLRPVVGDLAHSRNLAGVSLLDMTPTEPSGKDPSHWVVLARHLADLGSITEAPNAKVLTGGFGKVWTDDFSNIISVFKF